jgi:hypothetical protein
MQQVLRDFRRGIRDIPAKFHNRTNGSGHSIPDRPAGVTVSTRTSGTAGHSCTGAASCRRVLVGASPMDRVWGIGLPATDPRASDPAVWRGMNLLGFALTGAPLPARDNSGDVNERSATSLKRRSTPSMLTDNGRDVVELWDGGLSRLELHTLVLPRRTPDGPHGPTRPSQLEPVTLAWSSTEPVRTAPLVWLACGPGGVGARSSCDHGEGRPATGRRVGDLRQVGSGGRRSMPRERFGDIDWIIPDIQSAVITRRADANRRRVRSNPIKSPSCVGGEDQIAGGTLR